MTTPARACVVAVFATLLMLVSCKEDNTLKVTGIEPKSGSMDGGRVKILGNGFTANKVEISSVYFGQKKANVMKVENGAIHVAAPPGDKGTTVDVQVIFGDGREHKYPKAYTYINPKEGFDVNALAPGEEE